MEHIASSFTICHAHVTIQRMIPDVYLSKGSATINHSVTEGLTKARNIAVCIIYLITTNFKSTIFISLDFLYH